MDYPEVSNNLQDKTKHLLSLVKFMQISTNPKVRSNSQGLSFYKVTLCSVHCTVHKLSRIVMLLNDVCFVLHVTPLYPFCYFFVICIVLIVLISYITR